MPRLSPRISAARVWLPRVYSRTTDKEVSPFLLAPCHIPEMVAHLAIVQNNGELRDPRGCEEQHQIVQ